MVSCGALLIDQLSSRLHYNNSQFYNEITNKPTNPSNQKSSNGPHYLPKNGNSLFSVVCFQALELACGWLVLMLGFSKGN